MDVNFCLQLPLLLLLLPPMWMLTSKMTLTDLRLCQQALYKKITGNEYRQKNSYADFHALPREVRDMVYESVGIIAPLCKANFGAAKLKCRRILHMADGRLCIHASRTIKTSSIGKQDCKDLECSRTVRSLVQISSMCSRDLAGSISAGAVLIVDINCNS